MIRMIVAPLLVLATAAGAQECVYKSVMTDAEREACRHPASVQATATRPSAGRRESPATSKARTPEQIATDKASYEAQVRVANETVRKQKELDAAPIEPYVGMTTAQADAMMEANSARWRAYDKAHPVWAGGGSAGTGYDPRWGRWSGCLTNRTTTARGAYEQWVCGSDRDRKYIYFDNGVLTAIQD
jgi:hypothetical protein